MTETKQILIVEDDSDLRFLTMHQLKKLGYASKTAEDGKQAVDLYKEGDYRLILMDVMMPVLDGCSASVQIRQIEKESGKEEIPIIALTAISDRERCMKAGMNDYLFKPVLMGALEGVMKKWAPLS